MGLKLDNCDAKLRARIEAAIEQQDCARPAIPHPEQCECEIALATGGEGEAQGARCPHVCFTLRRVKLLDVDAKYASTKDVLDGLAIAKLIPGDKEGQITLEVNQVKVAHYKDEQTIIEISPIL